MTFRTTEAGWRIAAPVIFAFMALFVVLSAYQLQQWDSDIFWALKSGEWIVTNLQVPKTDPFSYTFGGRPWVDFTWGFQVLAYLSYAHLGGWAGLFILQALVVSLTFVFLYIALRAYLGERAHLAAPVLLLVYAAAHARLFIRPHLFEFFFVALYFMLFALHEKKGSAFYLFLILPAQVLWINIHSSAILGLFMAGAFALGRLIDAARERGLRNFDLDRSVVLPGVAALLAPLVSLVNPYGLKLVLFPFIHNSVDNADAIRHIGEWASPGLREMFFFLYPFPVYHFAFLIIFIGALICLVLRARHMRAWSYMLFAGALYMAVSHVRWVALFSVFGGAVLAMGLGRAHWRGAQAWRGRTGAAAAVISVVMLALLGYEYFRPSGELAANRGLGLKAGKFPVETVAYLKREGIRGNLYNEYIYGGYIIHELPEVKVFIDGRTPTVYSPYFFWTSRLAEDRTRWKRLEAEHDIDIVLIKHASGLCGKLRADTGWAAVSFDDVSILYLRRDRFPHQAARAFSGVNACSSGVKVELPEDRQGLEKAAKEIEGLISSGNGSARARRLVGLAYSALGEDEKAAVAFREAVAIKEDAYTWHDLGVALGRMKQKGAAISAFERSVELDGGFGGGRLALGAALKDAGEYGRAIASLTRYLEIADDGAEPLAYSTLGMSYFHVNEFEKAAAYLRRAAFMTDDPGELADLYYHIGNSHFELSDYAEGAGWYEKALSLRPGYAAALRELAAGFGRGGRAEAAAALSALPGVKEGLGPAK